MKVMAKQACDVEAGDVAVCRDGGARAVYSTYRQKDQVTLVFSGYQSEVHAPWGEVEMAR